MSANSDIIDLNSDALPGDRVEAVHGDSVLGWTTGPLGGSSVEEAIGEIEGFGALNSLGVHGLGVNPSHEAAVGGSGEEGLNGADIESGDIEDDNRGNEVAECSGCTVEVSSRDGGIAGFDGLVLNFKDDESARHGGLANVVGAVGESASDFVEVGTRTFCSKADIDRRREMNLMPGGDGDKLIQGFCASSSDNPDDRVPHEHGVKFVSLQCDIHRNSFKVPEFVDYFSGDAPGTEVKAAEQDDFSTWEDKNVVSLVFEAAGGMESQTIEVETQAEADDNQNAGVGVCYRHSTINESTMANAALDFNLCIGSDVNGRSEAGISSGENKGKDASVEVAISVSDCQGEDRASHFNGFNINGMQDRKGTQPDGVEMKDALGASELDCYEKGGFMVSDLVWGKVRSHPWWPGQIFDPSAASEWAMKYFKRDCSLVAYFGDQTFAWNDASRLKPFRTHFSLMENQSNSEALHHAIHCALDEVSRRVEFGLACRCIAKEVYAEVKSQVMVSAGIREESSRGDGGDRFSDVTSFEPMALVEYMKELAQFPCEEIEKLKFVVVRAQLLAFSRWKGYPKLSEFEMLGGLLEDVIEVPVMGVKVDYSELTEVAVSVYKDDEEGISGNGKLKPQEWSSYKWEDGSEDGVHPSKKKRSLSDLMVVNCSNLPHSENESAEKVGGELTSSSSSKKHKAVDCISDDSIGKNWKGMISTPTIGLSSKLKQQSKVGERVCRVASQLTGSIPILKYGDETLQKNTDKNKCIENSPLVSGKRRGRRRKVIPVEYAAADEMRSELCLAARDPLKGYNFLNSLIRFFSEFRNSVSLEYSSLQKHKQFPEESSNLETTDLPELEGVKDSYWTDRIIQSIPEEQTPLENEKKETGEFLPEIPIEVVVPSVELEMAADLSPNLDSGQQSAGRTLDSGEKTVDHVDEKCDEEGSTTALILSFTSLDSVPSEANLNKIFSRYGHLREMETEVMKKSKRAKVVFERRSDAEIAFSSAGKFSIFGPALVSYRLKYLPPRHPRKPSTHVAKRRRKASIPGEGNAT